MDGLALGAEPKSRIPLENVFNNTPTHQPKPRGRPPVSKPSSARVQTLPKGRSLRPTNPPSTLDDSMGSSAITVTDGRRRAALRIKARIQEERRLGIRKKKVRKKVQGGSVNLSPSTPARLFLLAHPSSPQLLQSTNPLTPSIPPLPESFPAEQGGGESESVRKWTSMSASFSFITLF